METFCALLGAVAGGTFGDVRAAMAGMSQIGQVYEPAGGSVTAEHDARYRAFIKLQEVAREIR